MSMGEMIQEFDKEPYHISVFMAQESWAGFYAGVVTVETEKVCKLYLIDPNNEENNRALSTECMNALVSGKTLQLHVSENAKRTRMGDAAYMLAERSGIESVVIPEDLAINDMVLPLGEIK